jgi:hypothetical protein
MKSLRGCIFDELEGKSTATKKRISYLLKGLSMPESPGEKRVD